MTDHIPRAARIPRSILRLGFVVLWGLAPILGLVVQAVFLQRDGTGGVIERPRLS